jgi:hypothetical protein
MPPAVIIDLCFEAGLHPRRGRSDNRVADRARTGVLTFPWNRRMALHPAAVLADGAFHRSQHAQRKRELGPVDRVISIDEILQIRRHVAQMQITADRIALLSVMRGP